MIELDAPIEDEIVLNGSVDVIEPDSFEAFVLNLKLSRQKENPDFEAFSDFQLFSIEWAWTNRAFLQKVSMRVFAKLDWKVRAMCSGFFKTNKMSVEKDLWIFIVIAIANGTPSGMDVTWKVLGQFVDDYRSHNPV